MNPSAKPSQETTTNQSASVDTPLDLLLDARVQPSVTSNMIGTIYTNSVSDPERDGHSAVRRSFRNLGTGVEDDGQWIGTASRISPQGMPRTSASSSRNQPTRSHSSGSCSPADTSSRTKNLTSFSHRRRYFGENRSQTTSIDDEQQRQQQQRQRQHHHLRSSSDRLSAASADEDVFLARCRESESPTQKQLSHRSAAEGPQRSGVRSSGAHGCDNRTGSPRLDRDRVQSDSDRGPPREGSSFTGSVRLTLKQKSEDLPDDGGSQRIRTLSTRTNSSTDEFPGVIRAHSKAISYESICLRIKEESTESPKSIQVISLSQPANVVSAGHKTVLPQQTVNTSNLKISRSPPFSAIRSCEVPPAPDVISTRPVQRDHSTKHRSTVFFSSNADSSRSESSNLLPIQMVISVPAGKLVQQNIGEGNRKSALGQPSKMYELLNENRFGIMALNKECRAAAPQVSTQTPLKGESEERRKLTVIGEAEGGTKSDERLLNVGPAEQTSSSFFDAKTNLDPPGKGSKLFIQRDQQPSSNSFVMGTVFTDRRNQPHPGTDFVQRNSSGRTPELKASESSKSMQQLEDFHDSTNAFHLEKKLSQLDRNPGGFEPSSDVTNRPMTASSQAESTSKFTTLTSRQQGPSAQRQPIRDTIQIDPGLEISASRNPTLTKDDPRGSKGRNESPLVRTRDTEVTCVLSEDRRAMRTDLGVKPEVDVARGRLTKTRSIPSLEISEEDSKTTSPSTVTSSSSSMKSTPEVGLSKTTTSALAKKTQNPIASTPKSPLSSAAGGSNPSHSFAIDTVQNYSSLDEFGETGGKSPSAEAATMDPDFGGLGKTAEMEKTRRFVRFESEEELSEFSPKECSDSIHFHTPADVPAGGKPDAQNNATKSDAISTSLVSMKPAVKSSPKEDSILKSSGNDPVAFTDSLPKAPRKDSETHEDIQSKVQKKDSDPSIRDDASTKTSPSTGRAMSKPGIVRKQLVHLDSALHPSSCVPPGESKPVEARWSPKLVRKLNLAEAKDVDVSDLDVAPDLLDFLSRQMEMEMASVDAKQPAAPCEVTGDGLQQDTGRTQGIPAALSAQRKPPLALPLKPTEREEDAPPPSTSAADNDDVKPEAEVGKRKFFSALKANAQSFRAKKTSGADDPSPDKSHLDRLASFALISDVGIGSKRRQFQQHKEASLSSISTSRTDPTADAQAKRPSAEPQPSTNRAPMKDASHSGTNDDKTKTRLGRVDESETRLGTESEPLKTRLGGDERAETRQTRPEVDSDDDDFDRLVEINFRQLMDEKNRTSSGSQADGPPTAMELLKGDRTQTGTGSAGGVRGQQKVTQGVRRQMTRFKTQPVTTVEVEKAREMNLLQNKSEN